MGTRYSTLGVGQSYIMLRVFENADNNPFAAILRELDHTLASRHLVCSQLAAYAPKATPKQRRGRKWIIGNIFFDSAIKPPVCIALLHVKL